jgi:hypothetical protein
VGGDKRLSSAAHFAFDRQYDYSIAAVPRLPGQFRVTLLATVAKPMGIGSFCHPERGLIFED